MICSCNPGLYFDNNYGFSDILLTVVRVATVGIFYSFLMNEALLKSMINKGLKIYIRLVEIITIVIASFSVLKVSLSDQTALIPNEILHMTIVIICYIIFAISFFIVLFFLFAEEVALSVFLFVEFVFVSVGLGIEKYAIYVFPRVPSELRVYIFRIEFLAVLFGIANIFLQPVAPGVIYQNAKDVEGEPVANTFEIESD